MRRERRARRATVVAAAEIALCAVLAALVAGGETTRADQYAVDHLMPGLYPYVGGGEPVSLPHGRLVAGWNPDRLLNRVADQVTRPASIVLATLVVLIVLLLARRIDRRAWLIGYCVAVAAELIGKNAIHAEPLYVAGASGPIRLWKFEDSFPSGHATRALFLAGLVGTAWPRLRIPATVWAAVVVALLVLAGTHKPSDVAGGVLLAAALVVLCRRAPFHRLGEAQA